MISNHKAKKPSPIPKSYRVVLTRWRADEPEPTVQIYDGFNGFASAWRWARKHHKAKDVIVEIEADEMFQEVHEK